MIIIIMDRKSKTSELNELGKGISEIKTIT